MPGFFGFVSSKKQKYSIKNEFSVNYKFNDIKLHNSYVARFTLDKFIDDKIFAEDRDIFICIEGVVLNFKDLQDEYTGKNYFDTIKIGRASCRERV